MQADIRGKKSDTTLEMKHEYLFQEEKQPACLINYVKMHLGSNWKN